MKEILEHDGVPESQTGSPRQILKLAYQMGMIKDEELWLAALKTRNNVAHSYNMRLLWILWMRQKINSMKCFVS